ncbi:hypothetical protein LTS12_028166 [Elasticomyces elasticus]|nr:hypothetical protein LTS12_028166 [Elasticomyces elasticus]
MAIEIIERNEVNQPTATYVYTESNHRGRFDLLPPSSTSTPWYQAKVMNILADVFLPAGYPHSVSEDYLSYQIFVSAMHALNRHAQTDDNKGLPASIQQLDSRTFSITGSVTGYTTTTTTNDVHCQQANR